MTISSWPSIPPPEQPDVPDLPYPYPPARPTPRRTGPVAVPIVDVPSGGTVDQLFARRRVLLSGPLDAEAVNRIAAELMALDGRSADDVEVLINSDGGPLPDVIVLLDVIAAMRARVATTCVGRAKGTAAVLLACGSGRRQASPNALISLRVVDEARIEGRVDEVRAQLDELELARRNVVAAVAAATRRDVEEVGALLDRGGVIDAKQARQLRIVDAPDT